MTISTTTTVAVLSLAIALGMPHGAMATPLVTIVVDDGGDDATCSGFFNLRCAINYANANPGTAIRFAPGLPAVLLLGSLPTITGNGTWIDGHDVNGGCVCPRIDGTFWSGPPGYAMTINANDVTISNLKIVRIPVNGNLGADIDIAGGRDTAIAFVYLGILPGATGCSANETDIGVKLEANSSGGPGANNGVAYVYGSVISCHLGHGLINGGANYVYLGEDRGGNVFGNYIGVASDGIHAAGNGIQGVQSTGDNTTIRANLIAFNGYGGGVLDGGNGSAIVFNVISNNNGAGLTLFSGDNKEVVGNLIGTTTIDGTVAAPNAGDGILILNGTGHFFSDNTIAHNGLNGITVEGSTTHALIENNSIFGNGGLPIDLGNDGPSPNGLHFPPGPNDWLPYPVITAGSGNVILGTACLNCFVFIYQAIGDPSAPGGGGTFLTNVFANEFGQWGATLPAGLTRGDVSMTAHDSSSNSSEMSPRWASFLDGFESGDTSRWSVTAP